MSERRFTLEEINSRLMKAMNRLHESGFDSSTPAAHVLKRFFLEELDALPAPEEFERKVWSDTTVEQISKPGATWYFRDDIPGGQTDGCCYPITVIYREGHD